LFDSVVFPPRHASKFVRVVSFVGQVSNNNIDNNKCNTRLIFIRPHVVRMRSTE